MKLTWKIWLLFIVLFFCLISISGLPPAFLQKGVLITSIEQNSTAFEQGIRQGQIITHIDGTKINNVEDFTNSLAGKFVSGENVKTIITTKDDEFILFTNKAPILTISNIPNTNIKTGLDLAGGSRALVKAKDKDLSSSELRDLTDITFNRFNAFGLTDIKVSPVSDLAGNNYMSIEIAGATPKNLEKLILEQGKFEAKIGDELAFSGGNKDIASVSRSGQESGIYSCNQNQEAGYYCEFRFVIYLSEEAAKRHADITSELGLNETNPGYLAKQLDLYLDNNLVDSLWISEGLKGRVTTQIMISGSGNGETKDDAIKDAEIKMKQLQTVLITGSLPYQLEIVKLDTISPVLGKQFINSILLAGLCAVLAVSIIILIRYRRLKSSLALVFTVVSEIIIILGIAAFIDWNLDLPSIAGILATIGTGIDQQIIIIDESRDSKIISLKQRLKRAFTIILGAYFTAVAAVIPLYWAVAGMFKGFAITTLIGITAGVLITRPAFSDIIKKIED